MFASLFIAHSGNPDLTLRESNAALNQKVWQILANGGRFRIITEADDYSSIQDAFVIYRSGINITNSVFPVGNVGIGTILTSNPNGYKLAVNGKIGAKEVQVENTSTTWADYVFEPDYKLLSLEEIEKFIKINKHLPEIPSQKDIEENGHKLGEMDVLLLKKIEEMMLYILQQEKRISELENNIKEFKNR